MSSEELSIATSKYYDNVITFNGNDGPLMIIHKDGTVDVSKLKPADDVAKEVLRIIRDLSKPVHLPDTNIDEDVKNILNAGD